MPIVLMAAAFFLVALLYASVGFGGGSTYNALLVLAEVDYRSVPVIALTCNILVVTGGVYHFYRAGHFHLRLLLPFLFLSVPMAWLGGRLPVSEQIFVGLLGVALLLSALLMLLRQTGSDTSGQTNRYWALGLPFGAGIGFLAGIVGIGGGIFLAPLLYLIGGYRPVVISALASGFILFNSLAGLAGQLMKQGDDATVHLWVSSWPLFVAVVIGGQLGSRLGANILPAVWVKRLTAVLVLYVSIRLLMRWIELAA